MKLYNTDEEGKLIEVEAVPQADFEKEVQAKVAEKEETWKKEKEDLEAGVNPNWKEIRRKEKEKDAEINRLRELEKKGKTLDDKGEVVDYKQTVTPQDVQKTAEEVALSATQKFYLNQQIKQHLKNLPQDKQEAVKKVFDKLSAGEQLDEDKVDDYMEMARNSVGVQRKSTRTASNFAGAGSAFRNEMKDDEDYADKPEGKEFISRMGLGQYSPKK